MEKTYNRERIASLIELAREAQAELDDALAEIETEFDNPDLLDNVDNISDHNVDTLIALDQENDEEDEEPTDDCAVRLCFQLAQEGTTLCVMHTDVGYCQHGRLVAPTDGSEPEECREGGCEPCRTCGEIYQDGGDGYDGECPGCADKSAEIEDGGVTDMEKENEEKTEREDQTI